MKIDLDRNPGFLLPWLFFLSLIIVASFIIPPDLGEVLKAKGVAFLICPYKQMTGHGCPLCGMTRAFVFSARFNMGDAFYMNPAGVFLYIYMLIYLGAGWIYLFFRHEVLRTILDYNAMHIITAVIVGSWLTMMFVR